jgi:predicted YcjX-like family ATPase
MSGEYVFESPDGGHTVYRRHVGKLDREMVSMDCFQIKNAGNSVLK